LRSFKLGLGAVETELVHSVPPGRVPPGAPAGGRVLGGLIRRAPMAVCRVLGEGLYRFAA
jgi:hypothetical protein